MESRAKKNVEIVPVSLDLIKHMKRIDGFNVQTTHLILLLIGFRYIQVEDYNAVLSLVDVSFEQLDKDPKAHLADILQKLKEKGGLDYLPRERTSQGRVFEHASDAKILAKLITQSKFRGEQIKDFKISKSTHFIRIENDSKQVEQAEGGISTVPSTQSISTAAEEEDNQQIKDDEGSLITIKKSSMEMTLKSKGKGDLYFQAFIWYHYLLSVYLKLNPTHSEKEFETEVGAKNIEVQRLKGLSESLKKVAANISKYPFGEDTFNRFVSEFGARKQVKKIKLLEELQRSLFVAQIGDDVESLYWIEKLLVQLLGYYEMSVRDQAVVLLNMLYDGVDWQLTSPFKPVVRCVGQHFKVNVVVDYDKAKNKNCQLFLGLSAPYPIEGFNSQILTWHKIDDRNIVKSEGCMTEIFINFGKFWKCGYFDWRILIIKDNGRLQPLELIGKPEPTVPLFQSAGKDQDYFDDEDDQMGMLAQGRFIIHSRGMRDHLFHEVCIDYEGAEVDTKEGRFIKRGTFKKLENNIPNYKKKGISALYVMGALERDNYPILDKQTNELNYIKPDASFLAITSRETPNIMHGGKEAFKKVVEVAKNNNIKIIVDSLSRISSSRHHRKYKNLLLYYLDEHGKRNICYGTDGQSINYEDTAILNYRKLEAWDLLIDEILTLSKTYGVDGIQLDNGQAWPQIMEPDLEELMRLDVDGEPAYTPLDLMNGEVVIRNENHGYWNTNMMEKYPNPFFIKLCRKLYEANPNFIIIGECWGGFMFENRQIILSRSGIIPRMFKLPQTICSLFGKKLLKDGQIKQCDKESVVALKQWYEQSRLFLPEGSIILQSSSAHNWPYPAYLYGKGTWAAVDVLYFMPDIPITFMGEIDGEVYRIGSTQVFQHEQTEALEKSTGMKRSGSQLMMALKGGDEDDEEMKSSPKKSDTKSPDKGDSEILTEKRKMPRVRSGLGISNLVVEQKQGDLKQKEEKFKLEMGPLQGFDLKKIHTHYEHRRKLRREKMALRYGQLVPLVARHSQGWHTHVLAFARHSLMETAIIATNLSVYTVEFWIDMGEIQKLYDKTHSQGVVIMLQNWLQPSEKPQYYFLKEFLAMKFMQKLDPFRTSMYSISICQDDAYVLKKTLTSSLERTKEKLAKHENIESEQISLLITDILEKDYQDVGHFANIVGSLQEQFMEKLGMDFYQLFINNGKLTTHPDLSSRLIALSKKVSELCENKVSFPPKIAVDSIVKGNLLGPIVFCTPELGRWSTVGGLGVMVDELAYGLAHMYGQDVWVISPYYHRNRKGEEDYLAKDPAGINYAFNVTAQIEAGYVLGVHEGVVHNVKVSFLHNSQIFPAPYADSNPTEVMRQMAVFAKGCLQYLCDKQIVPAICVTNDWFTGLVPAYGKCGYFGDTFKGTTFFHICHNLEPSYEGRLFPPPQQGALEFVHGLERHFFVDPYWAKHVVNPSRCAILLSDQWGTVSPSYRTDLLNTSPLQGILKQKTNPFAHPNGIPIKERIKKLDAVAPDHLTAKKQLQIKYFGYGDLDDSVPLLVFVGRVTSQKGVHLILDAAENLINKHGGKINLMVAGPANMKEPYSAGCAHKMWHLRNKYPHSFWADPNQFFTDGSLVNRGADFGMMPSAFEPGGIVQHEFFVGATPVIAFKTGGLKDSVFEFKWDTEEGNGYSFESHNANDFMFACDRAIGTYKNKSKYAKLRENAFQSTMDGEIVCRAWLAEFFRLRGKVFVDDNVIQKTYKELKQWNPTNYCPVSSFEKLFGIQTKLDQLKGDIDEGAEDDRDKDAEDKDKKVYSAFENPNMGGDDPNEKYPAIFMMHNYGPRFNSVHLCGSFDNWQSRHNMSFDHHSNQWFITLHLKRGKYAYKYIINGHNWVVNEQEPQEKDNSGNVNNVTTI